MHIFEDLPDDPSPDNENLKLVTAANESPKLVSDHIHKYEHLGDSVLSLAVTTLMLEMYLGLCKGYSSADSETRCWEGGGSPEVLSEFHHHSFNDSHLLNVQSVTHQLAILAM